MESNTAATKIASPCSHPFPARSRHDLGACYIPSGLTGNANPLLICGSGRDVENTIRYQPTSASAAAWRVFIPRGLTNTIVKNESSREAGRGSGDVGALDLGIGGIRDGCAAKILGSEYSLQARRS